jgi:hypothetical protein
MKNEKKTTLTRLKDYLQDNTSFTADSLIKYIDELLQEERVQIINAYGQGALDLTNGLNVLDTDYFKENFTN